MHTAHPATRKPRLVRRWIHLPFVRLVLFGLALAAAATVATIAARLLVPPAPSPLHKWVLLKNLLLPVLLLATYAWLARMLEARRATELAWRPGAALLVAGVVAGVAIISAYVLLLALAGAAHVAAGASTWDPIAAGNEILVPWLTAVGEELLFRAVLFRLAEEMFGTGVAVVASAILFAASHAVNPGADANSLLCLALGMGVLLALAYAAFRSLWLPIGLHMGWNIAEGFVFGLPNSGMEDPLQWMRTTVAAPRMLSGGGFGPEGSLLLAALGAAASCLLLRAAWRRRQWMPIRCEVLPGRSG